MGAISHNIPNIPNRQFVVTERGIVYLEDVERGQMARLSFCITDDGLLSFVVREKWLHGTFGRTMLVDPQDLVALCQQRKENCRTLVFPRPEVTLDR